jgi:hypothetical protein
LRSAPRDDTFREPKPLSHPIFPNVTMTAYRRAGACVLALTVAATACSTEPPTPDSCTSPPVAVTPDSASLAVGDTLLAQAAFVGPVVCRPINMTLRAMRWMASDSTIARVSAVKGYVVAKGPGEAEISIYFPADSSIWGTIHVTVVP